MKPKKRTAVLFGLRRYIIFFLAMDLIITCCMILFLNTMTRTTGIVLSRAHVEQAAKLTFLNVILLSLICTLIDDIRRRVMIRRPVRQIMRMQPNASKKEIFQCASPHCAASMR